MKNTILLLITMGISLLANSVYCQSEKVSLHLHDVTVENVLNEIESKSEYYFLFNQKLINVNRKVNIIAENLPINEILKQLFANENVEFLLIGRQIILTLKNQEFLNSGISNEISGNITDENTGEGLSGVNIIIQETNVGVISDVNGHYSITTDIPNVTLKYSYMGYNSEIVEVQGRSEINIALKPEIKKLDEIIVIGYGTVKRKDYTGSVFSINKNRMNTGKDNSINGLLQNTAPGALFLKESSQPGSGYSIRIRGVTSQLAANQPLYVVDGLPLDYGNVEPGTVNFTNAPITDALNSLNPYDILSVEILKDASGTAIYGSRGANGVIIITTRKGQKGNLVTEYSYSASIQKEFRLFEMMNAYQYASLFNRYVDYTGQNLAKYTIDELETFKQMGKGTDWQKEIQRPFGNIQDHALSFSGGKDDLNYYVSFGYTNHKGLVNGTDIKRYTGKVNLQAKPYKNLNIQLNISSTLMNSDQIHQESDEFGPQYNGVFTARQWAPIWPVRNDDGTYFEHPVTPWIPNPVANLEIDDNTRTTRSLGTFSIEYEFVKNFKTKIEVGGDIQDSKRGSYIPTTVVVGRQQNGIAEISNNAKSSFLGNLLFNYNVRFSTIHNINAMLGFSGQNFYEEGFNANQTGFPTDVFSYYNLGAGSENQKPGSFKLSHKLLSSFSRFNYSLYDKYLVTFTIRADGSSRFGKNNKWGFFPSLAGAWKIHNENFLKNIKSITQLKLRASYGLSGNQEFPGYLSLPLLGATTLPIGEVVVTGIILNRPANPDLKWETTRQIDVGLDIGLLKNRITCSFDIYNKLTYNLLQSFALPRSTGFNAITANNGKVLNKGFELDINTINCTGKFSWETSFNISYNKNRWKDRGDAQYGMEDEFGPLGGTYGYIVEGIFNTKDEAIAEGQPLSNPGQYNFKDIRGVDTNGKVVNKPDGKIDGNDRVLLGYWLPDYSFGLNNKFTYRNFDLRVIIQGMTGQKKSGGMASLFNLSTLIQEQRTNLPVEFYSLLNDKGGFNYNNTDLLNDGTANVYGGEPNSVTIEDASFVRLRNINLGYTLPKSALKWLQSFRIYLDIQNLVLLTKYTGYNPENNSALYPDVRTFTIGVNLSF